MVSTSANCYCEQVTDMKNQIFSIWLLWCLFRNF